MVFSIQVKYSIDITSYYLAISFQTKNLVEIIKAITTQIKTPRVELVNRKKLAPSLAISLNEETTELKGKE